MERKVWNPPTIHKPMGYSHVAEVGDARLIFIAGQVGIDPAGNLVGEGDYGRQVQQAFANLGAALSAAGATFRDIVKINYYCVASVDPAIQITALRTHRDPLLDMAAPPASTFVVVARLARPDLLFEVEAVAAVRRD